MAWTTIRDVRADLVQSIGGHAACQALGLSARELTDAAGAAWREAGCGRYDAADEDIRSLVLERAQRALGEFLAT